MSRVVSFHEMPAVGRVSTKDTRPTHESNIFSYSDEKRSPNVSIKRHFAHLSVCCAGRFLLSAPQLTCCQKSSSAGHRPLYASQPSDKTLDACTLGDWGMYRRRLILPPQLKILRTAVVERISRRRRKSASIPPMGTTMVMQRCGRADRTPLCRGKKRCIHA